MSKNELDDLDNNSHNWTLRTELKTMDIIKHYGQNSNHGQIEIMDTK